MTERKTSGKDVVFFASAIVASMVVAVGVIYRMGRTNNAQGYFQGVSPVTRYTAWASEASPDAGTGHVWRIRVRDPRGKEVFQDTFGCPWDTAAYWRWDANERLWALCSSDVRVVYWSRAEDGRWTAMAWGSLAQPPPADTPWPPRELIPPRYTQRYPHVVRRVDAGR